MDKKERIAVLNSRIMLANNPRLVDIKEIPINNIIYHLYNNGKVTMQKGGWAYGCLGETKDNRFRIIEKADRLFLFPNIVGENTSYAILSIEECIEYYKEMRECVNKN